jgi:predicted AlkP superfamily phosphohydrolase/phosphomutase
MLALISLDATSLPMLDNMIAEGRLPHLASLRQRGRSYAFESSPLFASVYPSLVSGVDLSNHGVYYPFQWLPSEQRICLSEDLLPRDSIFKRLTRAGKRICVLDPPDCTPGQFDGGIAVSGWQFESRLFLPKWSRPAGIHRALVRAHGRATRWTEIYGESSASRSDALRRILREAPARMAAAVETLMRAEPSDLLWVTFVPVHFAGHRFWDEPAILEEIIEAADAALGRIVSTLPDDAPIVVFSPKAMGANVSRADLLPEMLARVMGRKPNPDTTPFRESTLARVRAKLPAELRRWVAALMPDRVALGLTARLETLRVDWSHTRAFTLPTDGGGPGFVRLNLKGREREGIVEASEKDRLLDEIAAGLLTFNDLGAGPAIRAVLRPIDLVPPGEKIDLLPDLVVLWNDSATEILKGVTSSELGTVLPKGAGFGRSGEHVGQNWGLVVPGRHTFASAQEETIKAVDVSATACSLLGVPYDQRFGRPLLQ